MPIYEYRCLKCGEVFEVIQRFSDKDRTQCKFCKGKVERLISSSSFQLKGSGWYLTDYARKSKLSGTSSETGDKTGTKSESSKPDKTSKPDKDVTKND